MTILVIGNCVIDRSYEVSRLPRPGETMIAEKAMVDLGGKGLNQAVSAARAGARVMFATTVGSDSDGQRILAALRLEGIDVDRVKLHPGPTDDAAILVLPDGENSIVCSTHSAHHAGAELGLQAIEKLEAGDWLLMQGNIDRATTEESLLEARAKSARTIVNPSPILFDYADLWPLIDFAIVNVLELTELGGTEDFDEAAARLLMSGCGAVVLTVGVSGARLYCPGQSPHIVYATPRKAVDTTGAGDTCCGVFAAALSKGMSAGEALTLGVHCAGLKVTRLGSLGALPTAQEIADIAASLAPDFVSNGSPDS